MAAVSSCCKVSCEVRQRARPVPIIVNAQLAGSEHLMGTALETGRKVQATVGLYAPNPLGNTRATMVRTKGCNSERRS